MSRVRPVLALVPLAIVWFAASAAGQTEPAPRVPIPAGVTYLCLVLLLVGLGALFNGVSQRPVFNGGRVALVCVLVLGTVRIWTMLPGEPSGEKVGGVLGEALIPLAIAIWADNRYSKKKAELKARAAAGSPPPASPPPGPVG